MAALTLFLGALILLFSIYEAIGIARRLDSLNQRLKMSVAVHRRPVREDETFAYRDTLRRSTYLVDIAVQDAKEGLRWEPLTLDDPRAIAAINAMRGGSLA